MGNTSKWGVYTAYLPTIPYKDGISTYTTDTATESSTGGDKSPRKAAGRHRPYGYSLLEAQAHVYGAWFAQKGERVQIERTILEKLWNRRTSTLLKWEPAAAIETEAVYAEFDDIYDPAVPPHAHLCQATDGKLYASARLSNIYLAPEIKEHPRGGNRRKVRLAANAKLDGVQPAVIMGGGNGPHSLHTGRLYFGDRQTRRNFVLAHKALDTHLRKHGDLDVRHYVFGVQRHEVTVMLHSKGDPKVVKKRDWKAENTPDFLKNRANYHHIWRDR